MITNEIMIGSIGVSVILSILLRMIYNTWDIGSRAKPWIAVGCGILLAVAALFVSGATLNAATIASFLVQGFMTGATATGLYEMTKGQK